MSLLRASPSLWAHPALFTRGPPLLTVEEVDQALGAPDIGFRAPGRDLDSREDPHSRAYAEMMA